MDWTPMLMNLAITVTIYLVSFAYTYGKLNHKIKSIDEITKDFVTKERFSECITEIKRRLDEVNTIELNSRLSRIEAILEQIQVDLKEKK